MIQAVRPAPVQQHGAMEFTEPPVDLDEIRLYRLRRVRAELEKYDYAAIVLYDPINIRYATDVANMQVWCMHNENRYVFVPADGPVVLFEIDGCSHLAKGMPTVDEIRSPQAWYFFNVGPRYPEIAELWADEIADLTRIHGAGNRRVAVDRAGYTGLKALANRGIEIRDGFEIMEQARVIKSPEEISLMRCAIDVCEAGMDAMYAVLEPGITENALWSKLHETNIARGGEWIETRLLASGPRTNPWFRECSTREIQAGDLVVFDTDLVGPYGYCADISRGWVCGNDGPNDEQRRLHELAVEQIEHNIKLFRAGATFREVSEKAWPIPGPYLEYRYSGLAHGIGLCDEYPSIWERIDWEGVGYDGVIDPGMVFCVESYMGEVSGKEGMKLEQQILVTDDNPELLSRYPLDLQPVR